MNNDFDSWVQIIKTVDFDNFMEALAQGFHFIQSIYKTGYLPEPYIAKTNYFCQNALIEIIQKMFTVACSFDSLEGNELFTAFYQCIIQIAVSSLYTDNSKFTLLLYIFNYTEEYENNNRNFISFIVQILISATNQFQELISYFSRCPPLPLDKYATFYFLVNKFRGDFDENFINVVVSQTVPQFYVSLGAQNSTTLRSVSRDILLVLLNCFMDIFINDNLQGQELYPVYNFLRECLKCEIFDKQLFGANFFTTFFHRTNENCQNSLIQWFVNNNFFIDFVSRHPRVQLIRELMDLFGQMAKNQLLQPDIVMELWQQSISAPISDQECYFVAISICLASFDERLLGQFLEMIDGISDYAILARFYKTCIVETAKTDDDKYLAVFLNKSSEKLGFDVFRKTFIELICLHNENITRHINTLAANWIKNMISHQSAYEIIRFLFNESKVRLVFKVNTEFMNFVIGSIEADPANTKTILDLLLLYINYYQICIPLQVYSKVYQISQKSSFWEFMINLLDKCGLVAISNHYDFMKSIMENETKTLTREYLDFILKYYIKFSTEIDNSIEFDEEAQSYCLKAPNRILEHLFVLCGMTSSQTLTKFLLALFLNSRTKFESKIEFFIRKCLNMLQSNDKNQSLYSMSLLVSFIDSEEGRIDLAPFGQHRMKDSKKLFPIRVTSPDDNEQILRIMPQTNTLVLQNVLSALFSYPVDKVSVDIKVVPNQPNQMLPITYHMIDPDDDHDVISSENFPSICLSTKENTEFLIAKLQEDGKNMSPVSYKLLNRLRWVSIDSDSNPEFFLSVFNETKHPYYFKYMTERFIFLMKRDSGQPFEITAELFQQCLDSLFNVVLTRKFEPSFLVVALDIISNHFNRKLSDNDIYVALLSTGTLYSKYLIKYLNVIDRILPNELNLVINCDILVKLTKLTATDEIYNKYSKIIKYISSESSLYSLIINIITSPITFINCEDYLELLIHQILLKMPQNTTELTNQIIKKVDTKQEKSIPILCNVLKALFSPDLKNPIDITEFVTNLLINCAFLTTDEKAQKSIFSLSSMFNDDLQDSFIMSFCLLPSFDFNQSDYNRKFKTQAGLKNLGCTCYMNSILQQLASINEVIGSLCNTDLRSDISELLILFSKMRFGLKNSYTTSSYCEEYFKYNPEFHPSSQEDAVEYFNMLLESCPKQTKELFEGKFKEVYSRGEPDVKEKILSERFDIFTAVPVTVSGISDLASSLQQFLLPEKLTGDNMYTTEAGEKVEALRFTQFHSIPKYLVFHLKRFDINYYNSTRYKINSRFEFPTTLNMSEFSTINSLYRLKGAVIHMGHAQGGHYVSVIKKERKWILCDDSELSEIDENAFLNVAFGGDDNEKSAYLLFFERDDTVDLTDGSLFAKLPEGLQSEISETNISIKKQCSLLTESCFNFFLEKIPSELSLSYFFNSLCHSNDSGKVKTFSSHIDNCKSYIMNFVGDFIELIPKIRNNVVRNSVIELVGKSTDLECINEFLSISDKYVKSADVLNMIGKIFQYAASKGLFNIECFGSISEFLYKIGQNKDIFNSNALSPFFECLIYSPAEYDISTLLPLVSQTKQSNSNMLSLLRLFITKGVEDRNVFEAMSSNDNLGLYKVISYLTIGQYIDGTMNCILSHTFSDIVGNNESVTVVSIVYELIGLIVNNRSEIIIETLTKNLLFLVYLLLDDEVEVASATESLITALFSCNSISDVSSCTFDKQTPSASSESKKFMTLLAQFIPQLKQAIESANKRDAPLKLTMYFKTMTWLAASKRIREVVEQSVIQNISELIDDYAERKIILNYNLLEIARFCIMMSKKKFDFLVVDAYKTFYTQKTINFDNNKFVASLDFFMPIVASLNARNEKVAADLLLSKQFRRVCKNAASFRDFMSIKPIENLVKFVNAISKHSRKYRKKLKPIFEEDEYQYYDDDDKDDEE